MKEIPFAGKFCDKDERNQHTTMHEGLREAGL